MQTYQAHKHANDQTYTNIQAEKHTIIKSLQTFNHTNIQTYTNKHSHMRTNKHTSIET